MHVLFYKSLLFIFLLNIYELFSYITHFVLKGIKTIELIEKFELFYETENPQKIALECLLDSKRVPIIIECNE